MLTGAPGAGKSRLLEAALRCAEMARTAIVVNGPAAPGVVRQWPATPVEDVRLLAGGCVCCEVRADLEIALLRLLRSAARGEIPAFERVVLETGGWAEPAPLLQLFAASPALSAGYRIECVVTVMDAGRIETALATDGVPFRQVLFADRLLLTGWESMPPGTLAQAELQLGKANPHAERVRAAEDRGEAAWFAAPALPPARAVPPDALRSAHDDALHCFALRWDEAQPLDAIGSWLHAIAGTHGARILRARGSVAIAGEANAVAVHVVGDVVAPPAFVTRPAAESRVVFTARGLEPGDVRPAWRVQSEAAQPAAL